MATALEYGMIASLVAIAGIVAVGQIDDDHKKPKPVPVKVEKSSFKHLAGEDLLSNVLIDSRNGCRYMRNPDGISIRYRADGTIDCPGVPSKGEK